VLLGSDYPFDMGTLEGVRQIRALDLPEADEQTILGGAAARLVGSFDAAEKPEAAE
jgi:aminocarboxymuconate-semialdehyde decarboxylase